MKMPVSSKPLVNVTLTRRMSFNLYFNAPAMKLIGWNTIVFCKDSLKITAPTLEDEKTHSISRQRGMTFPMHDTILKEGLYDVLRKDEDTIILKERPGNL